VSEVLAVARIGHASCDNEVKEKSKKGGWCREVVAENPQISKSKLAVMRKVA
jgi:hypothetical protein